MLGYKMRKKSFERDKNYLMPVTHCDEQISGSDGRILLGTKRLAKYTAFSLRSVCTSKF